MKPNQSLDNLIERYCKAANALNKYRESHGFKPGARVECQFQDEPVKTGTIAEYGERWSRVDSMHVPVLLDDTGRFQPWNMRDLTVTEAP